MELPPRARRIRAVAGSIRETHGTTSACAENTPINTARATPHGNYLRVRGEYLQPLQLAVDALELPPRARRIHVANAELDKQDGTTSACAENTNSPMISHL